MASQCALQSLKVDVGVFDHRALPQLALRVAEGSRQTFQYMTIQFNLYGYTTYWFGDDVLGHCGLNENFESTLVSLPNFARLSFEVRESALYGEGTGWWHAQTAGRTLRLRDKIAVTVIQSRDLPPIYDSHT